MREVFVDDLNPLLRPAPLQSPFAQSVLAISGLTIDRNLCCRRLPNIDIGPSLEMSRLDFWIIAHELVCELEECSVWLSCGPVLTSGTPDEGSGGSAVRD